MADTIEQLKDKLQALEADSGGNKDRKKLEVALELCAALASLDMKRGVVQYADLAIDLDGDCVPAHCFRAETLQAMAQQRPSAKAASKAAKACARGLAACDRCVALEGLSGYRARLESMRSALPPPPPKKASTKSRAQPPQKLATAVVDLSSEDKPRRAAVTTADVRSAGGAPLRQSDWNKKDTWEERDVTAWAVERFAELLKEATTRVGPDLHVRFWDLRRVKGDAQVVVFQRKVKFLFDFSCSELEWVAEDETGSALFKGKATLRDCASGCSADDLELTTSFAPKNDQHEAVRAFLKKDACAAVAAVASKFEAEFVSLTGDGVGLAVQFPKSKRVLTPEAEADERRVAAEEYERQMGQQRLKSDLQRRNPNLKVEF